jgi:hypothetical protein
VDSDDAGQFWDLAVSVFANTAGRGDRGSGISQESKLGFPEADKSQRLVGVLPSGAAFLHGGPGIFHDCG